MPDAGCGRYGVLVEKEWALVLCGGSGKAGGGLALPSDSSQIFPRSGRGKIRTNGRAVKTTTSAHRYMNTWMK